MPAPAAAPAAAAVRARGLRARRGGKEVLRGVDAHVPARGLHALLGPNGSGKSTFLRVVAGLLPYDRGELAHARPARLVLQNPDHQLLMPTVASDVGFGLGNRGLPAAERRRRIVRALAAVNLGEEMLDANVGFLSGGQKQRVAIAGALAEEPQVLLLDELTTFLDAANQRSVLEAIRHAVTERPDVAAVWVTHRLEELKYMDTATFMEDGRVVAEGPAEEIAALLRDRGAGTGAPR